MKISLMMITGLMTSNCRQTCTEPVPLSEKVSCNLVYCVLIKDELILSFMAQSSITHFIGSGLLWPSWVLCNLVNFVKKLILSIYFIGCGLLWPSFAVWWSLWRRIKCNLVNFVKKINPFFHGQILNNPSHGQQSPLTLLEYYDHFDAKSNEI